MIPVDGTVALMGAGHLSSRPRHQIVVADVRALGEKRRVFCCSSSWMHDAGTDAMGGVGCLSRRLQSDVYSIHAIIYVCVIAKLKIIENN